LRADIISIGTELLMGELVDTNAPYLAAQLPPLGIELQRITQTSDDMDMLVRALQETSQRSELVLTTGGLGPTDDDLTREAIAQLLGEDLYLDPPSLERLQETFRQRGASMSSANIKQANLIPSARSIHNAVGTAPGWWVENGGGIIVVMPGPPAELHRMWEVEVQPQLRYRAPGTVIVTRSFKTHGLGESALNELIAPLFLLPDATLGMYAQAQGVQVRVRVRAQNSEEAQRLLLPIEAELKRLLGDSIWGVDDQVLEEQVGNELRRQGLTLAVMESCTGGLLAHTITQVPGSSHYFRGGVVSYSNDMKIAWGVDPDLILDHGAVSPQVAQDMARAARDRMGADLGIGITGVAGPEELEGNPAGTVHIALAYDGGSTHFTRRYPSQRVLVKQRATMQALIELWNFLSRTDGDKGEDTGA
jgi:nicotinamide-nucleotide amidase